MCASKSLAVNSAAHARTSISLPKELEHVEQLRPQYCQHNQKKRYPLGAFLASMVAISSLRLDHTRAHGHTQKRTQTHTNAHAHKPTQALPNNTRTNENTRRNIQRHTERNTHTHVSYLLISTVFVLQAMFARTFFWDNSNNCSPPIVALYSLIITLYSLLSIRFVH